MNDVHCLPEDIKLNICSLTCFGIFFSFEILTTFREKTNQVVTTLTSSSVDLDASKHIQQVIKGNSNEQQQPVLF